MGGGPAAREAPLLDQHRDPHELALALERDLAERVQLWLLVAQADLVWASGVGVLGVRV